MACPALSGYYENLELETRNHRGNGEDEGPEDDYAVLRPSNEEHNVPPKQSCFEQNGTPEDYENLRIINGRGQPPDVEEVEPVDLADYEDYRQINSVVVQSCEENICDTVQPEQEVTTSPRRSVKLNNYKRWFRRLLVAFCFLCVVTLGNWIAIGVLFNHSDRGYEELSLQAERRDGRVSSALALINQTVHEQVTVNGSWSNWDSWNSCSQTCGIGIRSRRRQCINPERALGRISCNGDNMEYQTCESRSCAVNGSWSNWDNWNSCSQTCGIGIRSRRRQCTNPEPAFGGRFCDGDNMEYQTCESASCAVNGSWSNWDNWNSCSLTCGVGIRSRRRQCTNPEPAFGGISCDGDNMEYQSCESRTCAVNGSWSNWDSWNSCSQTCGIGIRSRRRQCINPERALGGISCNGDNMEYQTCESRSCAVNGSWSNWDNWNSCSQTCGIGIRSRRRQCSNPEPAFGGRFCDGDNMEYQSCESRTCAVNGGWSAWGSWDTCSKTCASGIRSRTRSCNLPTQKSGGRYCDGNPQQYKTCWMGPCPISNTVRLMSGGSSSKGRVEVYYNSTWGTVCDDLWNSNDAKVVCRMFGYTNGNAYSSAHFGQGSGVIWLDDVSCDGSEPYIQLCRHRGWGIENCGHYEDAGVSCY